MVVTPGKNSIFNLRDLLEFLIYNLKNESFKIKESISVMLKSVYTHLVPNQQRFDNYITISCISLLSRSPFQRTAP